MYPFCIFKSHIPAILAALAALSALLALSGATSCTLSQDKLPDSDILLPGQALGRLNHAIAHAPQYRQEKEQTFDSLKKELGEAPDRLTKCRVSFKLTEQYRQVNADSSLFYAFQALRLAPEDSSALKTRGHLAVANAMSTAGLFIPATHTIDSIRQCALDIPEKIELWKSSRMLYSYMLAYVQDHGIFAERYRKYYIACDDSLLAHLPKDDNFYKFIHCERLVSEDYMSQAKTNLENLMKKLPPESNLYGMAAYQLAEVYKSKGDFKGYAMKLALAAESDIKGCVREGLALPTLANWLYEHGDLDNAFNYINFALEDANTGNIRMRTVSIATLMPVIDEAYRSKINAQKNQILIYLFVTLVLFLIAAASLAGMVRGYKRMHANEKKLASTSKKLEAYVGNFIGLCSNYASRLDMLTKLVTRKICAGQSDDLLKLISSGKFTEDDNEEFYKLIDKALLDLFPDFVESINTLLLPDKQITLSNSDPLTPELRIYAFVRLGVDQSNRIAQILNYSVNTVYSYRNRMRNRAIDRDNFDRQVASLGDNSPETLTFGTYTPR